jgi:hypothetical protein
MSAASYADRAETRRMLVRVLHAVPACPDSTEHGRACRACEAEALLDVAVPAILEAARDGLVTLDPRALAVELGRPAPASHFEAGS